MAHHKYALQMIKLNMKSKWYHGTFTDAYEDIQKNGIDVEKGIKMRRMLDFGPGFYLTSNKSQAERFILGKHQNIPFNKHKTPCVIEYNIDIRFLISQFNGHFLFEFDKEFADFVTLNREKPGLLHSYDFVYGKVADGKSLVEATNQYRKGEISESKYLRTITHLRYADDDQLSIHNRSISDIIKETNMRILERS
ncbi:DUF3990 domain-containing protein [Exiguobacterium sp. s56]|uniref:DUF3990 domain-containing protein n=1 Tax=Exiguobacterium sp. s56 TaxID=2751232 RepID=UPI001BEA4ECF|nr:DUF3990 domain-containing protein [Exiguobacterium sp. s56]